MLGFVAVTCTFAILFRVELGALHDLTWASAVSAEKEQAPLHACKATRIVIIHKGFAVEGSKGSPEQTPSATTGSSTLVKLW